MAKRERIDAFLAVGHGETPDGLYDPGAVAKVGDLLIEEHKKAHEVVDEAIRILRNRRFTVRKERDTQSGHDPNYIGSVARANGLRPRLSIEVHFDWSGAPRGGFGIYGAGRRRAKKLARSIRQAYQRHDLPVRDNYSHGFYFPLYAPRPSIIWESDRVGLGLDINRIARALADGISDFLR